MGEGSELEIGETGNESSESGLVIIVEDITQDESKQSGEVDA